MDMPRYVLPIFDIIWQGSSVVLVICDFFAFIAGPAVIPIRTGALEA